jgi:hypothetical protein
MNRELGDHSFKQSDSIGFAEISGDFNPLHLNPLDARRTLFGRPVVHGIHLLLWSLSRLIYKPISLSGITAKFHAGIGIGEKFSTVVTHEDSEGMAFDLNSQGATCTTITLTFDYPNESTGPVRAGLPARSACRDLKVEEISKAGGHLDLFLDLHKAEELLPGLLKNLPARQIAILLATTRLVGMECPGLYSIYSQLRVHFHKDNAALETSLDWSVERFDRRSNKLDIGLSGSDVMAKITAFVRPRPQEQPSFAQLQTRVPPNNYAYQKAFVIGGSRGIGEVCAKILAAGGADVCLTFRQGADDALRVVEGITQSGGRARAIGMDVLNPPSNFGTIIGNWFPSHLYYFATPPIFVAAKGLFSHDLFQQFYQVYVKGVMNIYNGLRRISRDPLHIYYPSSVAVSETPVNMGEYAAAKAAGEGLCRYLSKVDSNLRVKIDRLPRLPTDQTASLIRVNTADIVNTLLASMENMEDEKL